jgi:hypothetical protein
LPPSWSALDRQKGGAIWDACCWRFADQTAAAVRTVALVVRRRFAVIAQGWPLSRKVVCFHQTHLTRVADVTACFIGFMVLLPGSPIISPAATAALRAGRS